MAEIRSAVIEGTSVYYLRFEGESGFSVYVSAAQVPEAPLLNVGDTVTVYWNDGAQWITARKITVENRAVSTPPETPAEEPAEPETDLLPDTGTEEGAGVWQQTVIYGKA